MSGPRERIVVCVNLCAGVPSELVASPAFREMILCAADALRAAASAGVNPSEEARAESSEPAESGASPAPRLSRDAIGEIEAIVEGVLRRHGIVVEQREPQPAVLAESEFTTLKHIHTLSCYDDRGELLCGGAQ